MSTYSYLISSLSHKLIVLLVTCLATFASKAQVDMPTEEEALRSMFDTLFINNGTKFYQTDSTKLVLCQDITDRLKEVLSEPESFKYPFDSLNRIGIRNSQDKKVRIYTWNIKLENGQHRYYGFIQRKHRKKIQLFSLKEAFYKTDTVKYFNLTNDNWLGVNYYQIIDFKRDSKTYYLLIGMRNNGYTSKTKVLDVLSFSRRNAKFGKPYFKSDDKKIRRVLFEYSAGVSMMLQYDKRYKMVVFDHLAPENSSLKGLHRFYGPDGSYDSYKYNGRKWVYTPEVWVVGKKKRVLKEHQIQEKSQQIYLIR